jgi:hypothetical protein
MWDCQPVASAIWATVAPSGRRSRASTASCLVPWHGPVVRVGVGRLGIAARRPDRRGNLYPAKQRLEQTINAAVALMAVGRAMAEDGEPEIAAFLRDPIFG